MKKWLLKISALLAAGMATISMAGCVTIKSQAMSAYEIAVKNGFVGTEQEWLKSLECDDHEDGLSAYEIAVKNGFAGTEEDWIASLKGLDGSDGEDLDINAMYEAAKEDGFKGTMTEFLKEYFDVDVSVNNDTETIAHNVMSTVSLLCVFDQENGENTKKYVSMGSGVIYHLEKENGRAYIITNYHVIHESGSLQKDGISDDIYVYLHGAKNTFSSETYTDETGDPMRAYFVGGSSTQDIAVIAIENSDYLKTSAAEAVKIRDDKDPVKMGEKVYVIGNGAGRGISVSEGVVSAESETITLESLNDPMTAESHRVIRTDGVVNKCNSGGGLYDAYGELVGIVNAKSNSEMIDNVGYAIPIEKACDIADEAIARGKVDKGFLGVTLLKDSSSASIDENGRLVVIERIIISEQADDPKYASYGILQNGDIVISITIDGVKKTVTRLYQVSEWLINAEAGDTVEIEIERDGVLMTKSITFSEEHILAI